MDNFQNRYGSSIVTVLILPETGYKAYRQKNAYFLVYGCSGLELCCKIIIQVHCNRNPKALAVFTAVVELFIRAKYTQILDIFSKDFQKVK